MIHYYYTTFGDVYAGFEFYEDFEDLKIIVQADKLKEYKQLDFRNKTLETIKEFAAVFPASVFVKECSQEEIGEHRKKHIPHWWKGEYDRKVMFVIGAGASAYCVTGSKQKAFANDDLRPPLGNGLFAPKFKSLHQKYDGVKNSLADLQHVNVNVEEYLQDEWKDVLENGNPEIITRHINIQFYLQEVLSQVSQRVTQEYWESNLFAQLANKLQKIYAGDTQKKFAFVSFNQDSILETFLSQYFRKPLNSLDNYVEVNDGPFCVFKPHGSWNWGWKFPNKMGNRAKFLFDNRVSFYELYYEMLGNHVDMVDWTSWGHELSLNSNRKGRLTIDKSKIALQGADNIGNFYPAILLPYRDKDEFTMPIEHFERMDQYLSYVETLVIIGWKGNEAMFNQVLNQRATRIKTVIIADPYPDVVSSNLKDILARVGVQKIVYGSFEDFIVNGLDKSDIF